MLQGGPQPANDVTLIETDTVVAMRKRYYLHYMFFCLLLLHIGTVLFSLSLIEMYIYIMYSFFNVHLYLLGCFVVYDVLCFVMLFM